MKQLHGRACGRTALAASIVVIGAAIGIVSVGSIPVQAKLAAPVRMSYRLGPGVKLTTIKYPTTPQRVRILTITQGAGSVTDIFTPTPRYPGYRKPSAMGALGGATAIVNGDFAAPDGRPKHLSMVDGEVWTSGIQDGSAIGFASDGSRVFMGHPTLNMSAKGDAVTISIDRWNAGNPTGRQVAGFSQRGGRSESPSGATTPTPADPRYCAARLIPTAQFAWAGAGRKAITRAYTVDAQPEPCPKTPLSLQSDAGAVVLTAKGSTAAGDSVKALGAGSSIRLTWSLQGWPGVVDAIGAQPLLVQHGRNVAPPFHPGDSYFFNYNPRTAVGASAGCADDTTDTICKTLILTVDGRRADWSRGMRLPELADELIRAGAAWAANLDGGGGTVMWVAQRNREYCESKSPAGGCLVTRPSDGGGERVAVVSLGVKAAPDLGEPAGIRG